MRSIVNRDVRLQENAVVSTSAFNIIGGSLKISTNSVVKFLSNADITGSIQSVGNIGDAEIRGSQNALNSQVYTIGSSICIADNIVAKIYNVLIIECL